MINARTPARTRTRRLATVLLLTGAILAMFPLPLPACQWWAEQAQWVAVGYLVIGVIFLIFNRFRLMFVCFGCSAAISFFYHESQLRSTEPRLHSGLLENSAEFDAIGERPTDWQMNCPETEQPIKFLKK